MRKSFRYKAKLSPSAAAHAQQQLDTLRTVYNNALEERREAWEYARIRVRYFGQRKRMTGLKQKCPAYAAVDAQVMEMNLKRLDLAFEAFFRRMKAGERPGYPRFKSRERFDSMTYRQTGWSLDGRRLRLNGVGSCKLYLSRPIEGTVKTVTLRRDRCGDWFVTFSCEGEWNRLLPDSGMETGVDLGLESFLTTSDGEHVTNPRPLVRSIVRLKRTERRVTKRTRGGNRRRKMVRTLARHHRRVENARRDFHFKTALDLVRRYDHIAVEDLNVRGLSRSILAKSVNDAGWAQFLDILAFKAEEAGRRISVVDCRGTSQVCSGCGCEPAERKTLSVRVHRCEDCGLVLHRDHNAARNVLTRARAEPLASRPVSKTAA